MSSKKGEKAKPTKAALETAAAVQGARSAYAGVVPRPMRQVISLPVKEVRPDPNQPRKVFDEARISALASSIAATGQVTPITVRKEFDEESASNIYWIVAGERRWRAIMALSEIEGVSRTIDAVVLDHEHPEVVALVENVARDDLDVFEEAAAVRRLQDEHGFTGAALGEFLGWDKSTVSRVLRVASLDADLLARVRQARPDGRGFVLALVDAPEEDRADIVDAAIAAGELTRAFVRAWRKPAKEAVAAAPAGGGLAAADVGNDGNDGERAPLGTPRGGEGLDEVAGGAAGGDEPEGAGSPGDEPASGAAGAADGSDGAPPAPAPPPSPAPAPVDRGAELVLNLEAVLSRCKPSQVVLADAGAIDRLERVVDALAKIVTRSMKKPG